MTRLKFYIENNIEQGIWVLISTAILTHFAPVMTFIYALFVAFAANVLAGMRADDVKLKISRTWPIVLFPNFSGNKFKCALGEFLLILIIIAVLRGVGMLMLLKNNQDVYIFQYLTWVALYYYGVNSFRNLSIVYPNNRFIKAIYYIIGFKFSKMFGKEVKEILDNEKVSESEKGKK